MLLLLTMVFHSLGDLGVKNYGMGWIFPYRRCNRSRETMHLIVVTVQKWHFCNTFDK